MRGMRMALLPALVAVLLAGCGSSTAKQADPPGAPAATGQAEAATARKGPKLKVIGSDYGRVLADGHGRALYLFTADRDTTSNCSGACAAAWPPYLVKSRPVAGSGAKGRLIGTKTRGDSRLQATYRGHPLYYYQGDRSPGEINCQAALEFGGYWYVLRGSGAAVH